ncbi:hypothetical protein H0H92_012823 [Tricholoma furcatifolium]|nr:hypothetical protein H0H92_012823 [Tricholoma furcatifolium]
MTVDRGPSGIKLELAWLELHASKSEPFRRTAMQSPRLNRSVLEMCAKVIPLILPPEEYMEPTLWHPDFSAANILVSATNEAHIQAVTCLVDAMGMPQLPDDLDQRSAEEQTLVRERQRLARRQKAYEIYIRLFNRRRLAAINLPQSSALNILPYHISRSWSDGVGPITEALLDFRDQWEAIVRVPGTPCPLNELAEAEMQEYRDAAEQSIRYMRALDALKDKLGSQGDGRVSAARYEQVKQECERLRSEWDEERDGGPFPYQDGGFSFFLS